MPPHNPPRLPIQTLEKRFRILPHAHGLKTELGIVRIRIVCADDFVQVCPCRVARWCCETVYYRYVVVAALGEVVGC